MLDWLVNWLNKWSWRSIPATIRKEGETYQFASTAACVFG